MRARWPAVSTAAAPSKGGKLVKDPTKSTVPDPSTIPSAEEFAKNDNFGVVTAWCALGCPPAVALELRGVFEELACNDRFGVVTAWVHPFYPFTAALELCCVTEECAQGLLSGGAHATWGTQTWRHHGGGPTRGSGCVHCAGTQLSAFSAARFTQTA